MALVCRRGKSALRRVQTSNDTCVCVESKLRWVQDRALKLNKLDIHLAVYLIVYLCIQPDLVNLHTNNQIRHFQTTGSVYAKVQLCANPSHFFLYRADDSNGHAST